MLEKPSFSRLLTHRSAYIVISGWMTYVPQKIFLEFFNCFQTQTGSVWMQLPPIRTLCSTSVWPQRSSSWPHIIHHGLQGRELGELSESSMPGSPTCWVVRKYVVISRLHQWWIHTGSASRWTKRLSVPWFSCRRTSFSTVVILRKYTVVTGRRHITNHIHQIRWILSFTTGDSGHQTKAWYGDQKYFWTEMATTPRCRPTTPRCRPTTPRYETTVARSRWQKFRSSVIKNDWWFTRSTL